MHVSRGQAQIELGEMVQGRHGIFSVTNGQNNNANQWIGE